MSKVMRSISFQCLLRQFSFLKYGMETSLLNFFFLGGKLATFLLGFSLVQGPDITLYLILHILDLATDNCTMFAFP